MIFSYIPPGSIWSYQIKLRSALRKELLYERSRTGVLDQLRSTIHSNDSINKIGSSAVWNHFYVIRQKVIFPVYPFHQQIIFEANWTSEAEVWESPDAHQCLYETFCTVNSHKNNNDVFGLRKLYDQAESSPRNLKSLQMDTEPYWCHY